MNNNELNNNFKCNEHEHHEHSSCSCENDGCNCQHDDLPKIYLTLEDDTELECIVIDVVEVDGKQYIALLPENDERVMVYRYEENEDGLELFRIEDDKEFEIVSEAFMENLDSYEEE